MTVQPVTIVLSGPRDRRDAARAALTSAGLAVTLDRDGSPAEHSGGLHDSHEAKWSGARYEAGDIAALDEHSPGHGHAVGDVVHGTGEMVPVDLPYVVGFLTCEGTDVGTAHAAVQSLGWRVRRHFNTPDEPPAPTVEERLTRIDAARRFMDDELAQVRQALGRN